MGDRATRRDRGTYWDRAWSLVEGCTPVSPGCAHCWSAAAANMRANQGGNIGKRYAGLTNKEHFNGAVRFQDRDLVKPLHVRKPTTWAVWNDLFHEGVENYQIDAAFGVMAATPQHTYLVLTKRASRMRDYMPRARFWDWVMEHPAACGIWHPTHDQMPDILPNVWLGITLDGPEHYDRVVALQNTPAAHRYLSLEPLLGSIDLGEAHEQIQDPPMVDAVIIGCESGPHRRPCDPDWVRHIARQCRNSGVPCFVKQLDINGRVSHSPSEWPEDLRVRQLPWGEREGR